MKYVVNYWNTDDQERLFIFDTKEEAEVKAKTITDADFDGVHVMSLDDYEKLELSELDITYKGDI